MREYEVVFSYVKMIVEAESKAEAEGIAGDAMADIAMFYDIDRVDEY